MFFLHDILVIIGLSAVVLYLCHRLQVPVIVGFLVTGLFTGPYGFRLVGDIEAVTALSEIGIIALHYRPGILL
jgi:CPA2 family monovalent cation:H+ antiporter-2